MTKKRLKKNLSIKQKNLGVLLILILVGIILFRFITVLSPPPLTGYWSKEGVTYLCSNCTDCTDAIANASSGDIINLTADISNVNGTCIDFDGKDDVTLDCQGYYIEGDGVGTDYGIYLSNTNSGSNNNTLKNCNISNFSYGMHLFTSSNNTLTNLTSNSNTVRGIRLYFKSNQNTLTNLTLNSNNDGIYCESNSINNTLTNIISNSNGYGIYFGTCSNNTLTNITTNLNEHHGIYLHSSSNNNVLTNITANLNTEHGIIIYSSANNNVLTHVTAKIIILNLEFISFQVQITIF